MRPRFLATLALVGLVASAHAAELRIEFPATLAPGPVEMPITLHLAQGESVSGAQFELVFDETFQCEGFKPGESATASSKMVSANAVEPGRHRVIVAGFNQNNIGTGPIAVARFSVKAAGGALRIENAVLSDPNGHVVAVRIPGGAKSAGTEASPSTTAAPPGGKSKCGCASNNDTHQPHAGDSLVVVATLLLLLLAPKMAR